MITTSPASPSLSAETTANMSSSEVQIIAIINASADKMPTLEAAVRDLCQKVHQNETGVIAYQATTEKKKDGSGSVIFFERYGQSANSMLVHTGIQNTDGITFQIQRQSSIHRSFADAALQGLWQTGTEGGSDAGASGHQAV